MFFGASGCRPRGAVVHMHVRSAVGDGVGDGHVTFEPLMQVARLGNVNGHPTAVLGHPRIDVIAGDRPETRLDRVNLVRILLARLPGPIRGGGRPLSFSVTTEYVL